MNTKGFKTIDPALLSSGTATAESDEQEEVYYVLRRKTTGRFVVLNDPSKHNPRGGTKRIEAATSFNSIEELLVAVTNDASSRRLGLAGTEIVKVTNRTVTTTKTIEETIN